jgi:hypothetical protein
MCKPQQESYDKQSSHDRSNFLPKVFYFRELLFCRVVFFNLFQSSIENLQHLFQIDNGNPIDSSGTEKLGQLKEDSSKSTDFWDTDMPTPKNHVHRQVATVVRKVHHNRQ